MTEAWTHQFNSEADFLDFLKMKRELEELKAKVKYLEKAVDDYANDIVKKNETIGELRRASSPIECSKDSIKEKLDYFVTEQFDCTSNFLQGGYMSKETVVRIYQDAIRNFKEWLDESAASLPLPVESGWSDDDMKKAFNAGESLAYPDANIYLQSIKNQRTT